MFCLVNEGIAVVIIADDLGSGRVAHQYDARRISSEFAGIAFDPIDGRGNIDGGILDGRVEGSGGFPFRVEPVIH